MVRQTELGPITQMYLEVLTKMVGTDLPREVRRGYWTKQHSNILTIAVQAGIPGAIKLQERIARHFAKGFKPISEYKATVFVSKQRRNRRKVDTPRGNGTEAQNANPVSLQCDKKCQGSGEGGN